MNNTHGLKAYRYNESVYIRLNKANETPIMEKADYRYVKLGDEIFPIHVDMVDTYNDSDRSFKRGMKKQHKKLLKKGKKIHLMEEAKLMKQSNV